jgi:pimeloyl-ACP methyl ester carboxylesterase
MTFSRRNVLAAAGGAVLALRDSPPARAQPVALPATRVSDPLGGEWTAGGDIARAGGRIHYLERGAGEPLVLLPKLGGWAADWRKVAPLLATQRRVIAIDPPGHGGSTMLGPAPYAQTVAESAAMLRATLEALGVERFSLVGNSLGGCIGVLLASLWPASVRRLVLLSVSLSQARTRAWLRSQDAEYVGKNYDAHDLPLPRSAEQLARFGSGDLAIVAEQNESRALAGRWVRASERGVALAGIADYLPGIEAPTLLIYGERGNYREFEQVGRERIARVSVELIKDSGAFTQQERPEETARVINAFLDHSSS